MPRAAFLFLRDAGVDLDLCQPAPFLARSARLTSAPHQHVDHDPATPRVNDQSPSCRGPARFLANQFDALSTNQVKEPTSTTIPEMRQSFDIAVVLDGPEPLPI